MLTKISVEIVYFILGFLLKKDVCNVMITCKQLYKSILPYLYQHIKFIKNQNIIQLQQGVQRNEILKTTIKEYTRHITLQWRFDQEDWTVADLDTLFKLCPPIRTLTFTHYNILSTQTIHRITRNFPQLDRIEIIHSYIYHGLSYDEEDVPIHNSVRQLSLNWTEGTEKSTESILSRYPQLTHLELGSNQNKYHMTHVRLNRKLLDYCPHLTHLTIAIDQINEIVLCEIIKGYGKQLKQLSVHCNSLVLKSIGLNATYLYDLSIRINPNKDKIQNDFGNDILYIIKQCKGLRKLEIFSSIQLQPFIPNIIWKSIIDTETNLKLKEKAIIGLEKAIKCQENKIEIIQDETQPIDINALLIGTPFSISLFEEVLRQRRQYNLNRKPNQIPDHIILNHLTLKAILNNLYPPFSY